VAVLILNDRYLKEQMDFSKWLEKYNDEMYMFSNRTILRDYKDIKVKLGFESSMMTNGTVEIEALSLFKTHEFDRIIAFEEADILRAAKLRSYLNIKGQKINDAVYFRDKIKMKRHAEENGIKVAPYKKLDSPIDLYDFALEYDYPVIVKPISGFGANNTSVIESYNDLLSWTKNHYMNDISGVSLIKDFLVEKYIDKKIYHIDGIVGEREVRFISVFEYIDTCLSYQNQKGVGSLLLKQGSSLENKMTEFTKDLIKKFPFDNTLAFHIEVFFDEEKEEIILCEIASRPSGGNVGNLIEASYNFNVFEYLVKETCDIENEILTKQNILSANYFIPPKYGILKDVIDTIDFEWCTKFIMKGKIGEKYNGPTRIANHYAYVEVIGENEKEVRERINFIIKYIEEKTIWE